MADITIVNGVYKPTYNWGAPSCGDLQFFSRKFSHKIPRPNWPTTYYPHQINPLIFVSLSLSLSIQPSIQPAIHPSIYLSIWPSLYLSVCLSLPPIGPASRLRSERRVRWLSRKRLSNKRQDISNKHGNRNEKHGQLMATVFLGQEWSLHDRLDYTSCPSSNLSFEYVGSNVWICLMW